MQILRISPNVVDIYFCKRDNNCVMEYERKEKTIIEARNNSTFNQSQK